MVFVVVVVMSCRSASTVASEPGIEVFVVVKAAGVESGTLEGELMKASFEAVVAL